MPAHVWPESEWAGRVGQRASVVNLPPRWNAGPANPAGHQRPRGGYCGAADEWVCRMMFQMCVQATSRNAILEVLFGDPH
jgi:hypothetical protein